MSMSVGGKRGLHFWKGAEINILQEAFGVGWATLFSAVLYPPPQQQQGDAMCKEAGDSHFLKLKGC